MTSSTRRNHLYGRAHNIDDGVSEQASQRRSFREGGNHEDWVNKVEIKAQEN
ncbi:hypothetical protein COLO4_35992 [Corchorus olitorius]|uniref:Uncharacterized protein n=1 Tax=Corchorus olitorius TaxID=93759 RepID=A0A1R3GBG8_9ROSI|nr:hypothetical protein COLO4_35992 [Corchorus olitorius]